MRKPELSEYPKIKQNARLDIEKQRVTSRLFARVVSPRSNNRGTSTRHQAQHVRTRVRKKKRERNSQRQ